MMKYKLPVHVFAFRISLFLVVVLLIALLGVMSSPAQIVKAQTNWSLVWSDEFNGPVGSTPDSSKWGYDIGGGGWGNGELEYYTRDARNAEVVNDSGALDGKALAITAYHETNSPYTCWNGACQYTSARLLTKFTGTWLYGKFEVRAKVPTAPGIWPAFWMLGNNIDSVGWPTSGEIDNMEQIGLHPDTNYGTIHGPGYSGSNGIGGQYILPAGQRFADAYHTFTIVWAPNTISWYVDGNLYETHTPADLPAGKTWVYDHPFFMLLNMAVGNNSGWPGIANPSGYPQTMLVDYVKVWRDSSLPTLTPSNTPVPNTPYLGTPLPVPGTLEADQFDLGGEGSAYHAPVSPAVNTTNPPFRTNEGVSLQNCTDTGCGYNVAYIGTGMWMKYTVNVQTTGSYRLDVRVADNGVGGTFHVEQDGVNVSGFLTVPNTGGYQTWATISQSGVNLTAGTHVLRFVMDNSNGGTSNGNLRWFSFTQQGASATSTSTATSTVTSTATRTSTATATPTFVPPTFTATATTKACGTTNLALNKPATGSSVQVGNGVANGNDGSLTTRWAASGATFPQWWRVDLGSSQTFCQVVINWFTSATRTYKYKIETSNDDVTYTTIVDQTNRTGTGDTTDNVSATARYVRVTITGTSAGWASFYEFKVIQ
jgi:beta-glucanase (GH16 family)